MKKSISGFILSSILLLALAPVSACDMEENDFAIYFVAGVDPQNIYSLESSDLTQLKLEEEPVLTLEDIEYYDFSSHFIFLKHEIAALSGDPPKSFMKPFVAVASGQRCYLGYFISLFSSYSPRGPYISYPLFRAGDILAIENHALDGEVDLRDDPRIKETFSKSGKLRVGLEVRLTGVEVEEQHGAGVVTYSFQVTNRDESPLYFPDPDKMGSGLFHYYTNGLILTSKGFPPEEFWASQKPQVRVEPLGRWEAGWFTRLDGGETISRIVVLSGYPHIPGGSYTCQFIYSGPGKIQKKERLLEDGEIWIGEVFSSPLVINIQNDIVLP